MKTNADIQKMCEHHGENYVNRLIYKNKRILSKKILNQLTPWQTEAKERSTN